MTVGDAAVLSVVLSGGGMLSRAVKATIKNNPPVVAAYQQLAMAA
jgi:hypothetical protein